jgi:beta-lactamase superfamily II metal-dependent hydrolase
MRVVICTFLLFSMIGQVSVGVKIPEVDLNLSQSEYAISFLPLKKGEVAVLHLPTGEEYLINTGPLSQLEELIYYVNQLKIKGIEGIILTEESEIHKDTILKLKKKYSIKQIIAGASFSGELGGELSGTEILTEGETYPLSKELSLEVVHEGNEKQEGLDFSLTFFQHRFLWLSSQSRHAEDVFMSKPLKNVNIVKIPLHSKTECISAPLIKHIDPQTALLYRSKEKLLNGDLLEAINEAWIDLYLTGQHGLISIKFNRSNYEVITFDQYDAAFHAQEGQDDPAVSFKIVKGKE